jgi:chitinase
LQTFRALITFLVTQLLDRVMTGRKSTDSVLSPVTCNATTPLLAALFCTCLLLASGCDDGPSTTPDFSEPAVCTEVFVPKSSTHEVIGFYPSWKHSILPVSQIRWQYLTRVIYAFGVPEASGQIQTSSLTQAHLLVDEAHAHGVEVYLSIGGGAGSEGFPALAADQATRRQFVFQAVDFLGRHCMDGVDVDWEHWTKDGAGSPLQSEMQDFILLLQDLREALDEVGLKLSIDVGASNWWGQHVMDSVEPIVDEIHVMGYDFTGPWSAPGPHSSYEDAIGSGSSQNSTGLAYWTAYRQWPKEKIYLGVPFYGRDFDSGGGAGVAYSDIVSAYPDAPEHDRVANIYYNGVNTIEEKARHVVDNGYPGIMIWEIAHDTADDSISLLAAVHRTLSTR